MYWFMKDPPDMLKVCVIHFIIIITHKHCISPAKEELICKICFFNIRLFILVSYHLAHCQFSLSPSFPSTGCVR